ncbi:MAG: GNAT family N-acetyltransferase [Alphaproteobacteria bacterium]|nr:GNAT family N-acetyltransferase [Alphaproteobacteria bacterium]
MSPTLVELDPDRDAPALHALLGDEASCRYLPRPAQPDVEATRALLRRWHEGNEATDWAVQVDGATVGRVALVPRGADVWEAACLIVPAARGANLAARGLAPALDDVFDRRGAVRVAADIDLENVASIRVFERLGFTCEAHLRGTWQTHIGLRDSLIFALLRDAARPWWAQRA